MMFDIPKAGEQWVLKSDEGDPWGTKHKVKILDTKPGWIRYYMNKMFSDQRMRLEEFMAIYQPYEE